MERWEEKVDFDTGGCWNWLGSKYRGGYGHLRRKLNDRWIMEKAHRLSYEYFYNCPRKLMEGFVVCHTCDNPSCVNPEHLFLTDSLTNTKDKIWKRRNIYGRNSIHCWLSLKIANEIREKHRECPTLSYRKLGDLFGTSTSQIHRIIRNLIWKNKER